MEGIQCIPRITAGIGHHKEETSRQSVRVRKRVWDRKQQGVEIRSYHWLCGIWPIGK